MTDALSDLLDDMRRAQLASRKPEPICTETLVQYRSNPKYPGVTEVTIYAPTEQGAQDQINRAMRTAERDGVLATFKGPRRCLGGFGAIGELHI